MELFSLLAKLTLDSKQYESALDEAQDAADSFEAPEDQTLELDNTEYTGALDEAEDESGKFSDSVGSIFKELKGVLTGLGIAAVITGIVTQLKEGVNLAKEHGDMIDKQSKKMNLSAKAYQEWSYALELNGASIDDLNRGMRTWQAAIGDEKKTEELSEAFNALGINADDAFKKLKEGENLDSLLSDTIAGLARADAGDKGWIGKLLFGNSWNQLNPLLENSAETIADLRQEAHDLGMIMSDEEVANAAAYTDAVTRLEGSLKGIKEAFAADLLPLLTDAANTVAKIVAFFNPRNAQKSLADQWAGDDKAFAEELLTIEGTAAAAETLADKLMKMGDTSKMTADEYAIWKGTAEELIRLVPSLGSEIDIETGQIKGNTDSIKANIKEWEELAKVKALQNLKEKKYQELVERNQKLIDENVNLNTKEAAANEKKQIAIAKANEMLQNNQMMLGKFKDWFGADELTTWAQVQWLQVASDHYTGFGELSKYVNDFIAANQEAEAAGDTVATLTEELEKGKQEYQAWCESADALYGTLTSDAGKAEEGVDSLQKTLDELPVKKHITISIDQIQGYAQAKGNWNVPYDNYPSLLHRGEMVLTKSQARQYREGGGNVDVSGIVADAVSAAMSKVYVMLNGDKVGDLTTKRINKNINASTYHKLRSMGG